MIDMSGWASIAEIGLMYAVADVLERLYGAWPGDETR